ncbi:MAG: ABC transporter ATP-binding protein [Holdemanella porci]|uniref:ABC transporter ATP-binding protein n=1 Tax=Holdemanella TaxID=1573535 RepID=UPI003992F9CA
MLLNIQNIYKNYGKEPMIVPVLKDVSLEVVQGDYIAIMGPSGSGKTTLMNIIGCLDRASLGTYLFEDEDISEMNDDALSDLRLNKIGFVFQNFNLLSSETAQENVALPLIYAGIDKEKRNQRAIDVLNKVGLQDRISFKPSQLSGGQKQRVAIARAIINNPKILLADEPTGALDQASGKQVMELFKSLNDEGVTIIMITHDANVASHAKKIFHIIDGEIIENKRIISELGDINIFDDIRTI